MPILKRIVFVLYNDNSIQPIISGFTFVEKYVMEEGSYVLTYKMYYMNNETCRNVLNLIYP